MKSAVIAFISSLLVLSAQGISVSSSSKCKCVNGYIGRISQLKFTAEPVIHLPSVFCPHTEIIITTAANKEKCVDPKSPLGTLILKNLKKLKKKGAESMTVTSSQTITTASTL